jgi:8-oxo-dGTP diphosphatase
MQEVVGVAVIREGRVLAARRSGPPALAGLWEFPGGKVEPGEDPRATAVREIAEELGCTIEVTGWVDADGDPAGAGSEIVPEIVPEFVLSVATARLVQGDPVPTEHDAVRWLRADQLDEVSWAAADLPFLESVRRLLYED